MYSIYFYMVHENMYNYSQLYLHNLVKIIWAKHRKNDICKQKLIEYWFFDLQNFPCSMPLETIKTSNPTTEESQTGAFSLQQKIGFRKLQVQFFHLSQIIRINIMNLINTFKTWQNVCNSCGKKQKQENIKQDQPPSRFSAGTFPAPFARRPNGPRWVRVCLNVRELEDQVSQISLEFLHVIFWKETSDCLLLPSQKIREVEDSRSKWPYLISR